MRSGSHVQLAALRNRDLELQATSPFSNHGSVERSTACFRHKNVLQFCVFQKFPFFCVTLYLPGDKVSRPKPLESSVQGILSLEMKDRKVTPTSSSFNDEE